MNKNNFKIFYYSGSTEHGFFKEEFNCLKEKFSIIPSNKNFLKKTKKFKRNVSYSIFIDKLRKLIIKSLIYLGIPKIQPLKVDNKFDIIFSCGYLLKSNKKYIVTFEDISVFYFHNFNRKNNFVTTFLLKKILENEKCVGIIPWTKASKKSLFSVINSKKIKNKTKVIYPSIKIKSKNKNEKKTKIKNILFIGGNFLHKGGYELYLAFKKLNNSNVILHIVSTGISKNYLSLLKKEENIRIYSKIKNIEMDRLYTIADIYVMPTHIDTLGFTFLEAMSYGVPCISCNNFAVKELITNNKTGFVIKNYCSLFDKNNLHKYNKKTIKNKFEKLLENPPSWFIEKLKLKMENLLNDEKLRKKMSFNCIKEIKSGKFSINNKNNKLKFFFSNIYK